MKKKRVGLIAVIGIIFLVIMSVLKSEDKEIRVRIIPSSNSEIDIQKKNQIKDEIEVYLHEKMDESTSYELRDQIITNSIEELVNMYPEATVYYGWYDFPIKTYNGNVLKPKKVKALVITIGEGLGDNWWGSLYPSLLGIQSSEKVTYKSFIWEELLRKFWK